MLNSKCVQLPDSNKMRWLVVILICAVKIVLAENGTDTDAVLEPFDYYSMPALSELDDFDLCLRKPNSVYCIVDFELLEDDTPLYQFIKNFSTFSYKNYKHTKLHRGVCGSEHCGMNHTHVNVSDATVNTLKECFNRTIHQGYGLQVDSLSVRYCKIQNDHIPVDALDYIIGALLLLLLLVNLGCSAYYFLWPPEKGEGNRFMLAFCVQKNWKALKYGGSAEGGIFKCFQAMRFSTMVMILGLHSMIFIGYGYTENPEFIEKSYDDFFKSLLYNARVIVQIFFVMGGFLMAYKMMVYAETHPFSLKTIPMAIVNRWFRLMPAVLVVMGLAMTWVPHLGSGPMWDAVVKRERDICRQNWWQLVILMPNLFPFEHLCLPQAWYLGTDTQLFFVTLVVLLIIWKWPKSGVPILSSVMVISLLIPFLQSYFMNLLPIRVSLFPESIRDIFGYNDTFYHAYISAQGNWAGYHLGVLTAWFYHKAQTKKWDLGESKLLKLMFVVSLPVAFGSVLMGWDLHDREASAFESAVFNTLNQNFFALAICVFIIGYFYKCNRFSTAGLGAACGEETASTQRNEAFHINQLEILPAYFGFKYFLNTYTFFQNLFKIANTIAVGFITCMAEIYVSSVEWGPLQPLGRMSYCAMLLHATVLRTYGGQMRRSFYATDYTAIMLFAGIVCTTYLWSLPLYLFVEAPACQVQKILFGPKRQKKEQENGNSACVKPGISSVSVSTVSTHI